jgi:hypothetical protein
MVVHVLEEFMLLEAGVTNNGRDLRLDVRRIRSGRLAIGHGMCYGWTSGLRPSLLMSLVLARTRRLGSTIDTSSKASPLSLPDYDIALDVLGCDIGMMALVLLIMP